MQQPGLIMDTQNLELSLEQSLHLEHLKRSLSSASREQLESMLIETARLVMIKENCLRFALKQRLRV